MLLLTDEDILEDIREFEQRIQAARDKLSELPETADTWPAKKKLKEKRYILGSEIEHVKRLISIAEEALST